MPLHCVAYMNTHAQKRHEHVERLYGGERWLLMRWIGVLGDVRAEW
jgi:hypothetical protein